MAHQSPGIAAGTPCAWLVLAGDNLDLPAQIGQDRVQVVRDPEAFRRLLALGAPRVVVCSEPPAGRAIVAFVAEERRRRPWLRAMHLAPPEAVDSRMAALEAGFDDALPTTTPLPELLGRLHWLDPASRAHTQGAALLPVAADFALDPLAHVLRRGASEVHLRPKEYSLLALLASQPGRAYSRRELLDQVWGTDRSGESRTVDVHVRWLRSKIEPVPNRPVYLVTVRGVGYRLDAPIR